MGRALILLVCAWFCIGVANAYTFSQPAFAFEQYLEANPSQQALLDQFAVRIRNQPTIMSGNRAKAVRIGMLFSRPSTDLHSRRWLQSFKRRLQEIGVDFRLDLFYLAGDINELAAQLDRVHASGFDYIAVDDLLPNFVPQIQRWLVDQEVKLILHGVNAPVNAWRHTPPLLYVGVDEQQVMDKLASLVARDYQDKVIDALVLKAGKMEEQRCSPFLNALKANRVSVRNVYAIEDSTQSAFHAMTQIQHQGEAPDFVFSCSYAIQQGVIRAIKATKSATKTNIWAEQGWDRLISDREYGQFLILYPIDDLGIATAEAIRVDLENRLLPTMYVESVQIARADLDLESLELIFQQSNRYWTMPWRP